jgi:hypothetical protein
MCTARHIEGKLSTGRLSCLSPRFERIDTSAQPKPWHEKTPHLGREVLFTNTKFSRQSVRPQNERSRMETIVPSKNGKCARTGTIGPVLEHLKSVISVLWQTARMVHAWSGNDTALAN